MGHGSVKAARRSGINVPPGPLIGPGQKQGTAGRGRPLIGQSVPAMECIGAAVTLKCRVFAPDQRFAHRE
jgi:hypothetical protein